MKSRGETVAAFEETIAPLLAAPGISTGKAFHAPAVKAGKSIFAMLVDDELVVKLPAERCSELVGSGVANPFRSGQRVMRQWASVPHAEAEHWDSLAREALAFVGP